MIDISDELKTTKQVTLYHCPDSDLRFFGPPNSGSEVFYESLQNFPWYYLDDKSEYSIACNFLSKNDLVLDVGCGKGAFSKCLNEQTFVGLELSSRAFETATSGGLKVFRETIEKHAEYSSGIYDAVCAFQVLEHVQDVYSFISSCIQCIKPGGHLIVSVPSFDSFVSCIPNYALNLPPHHLTWWSDNALAYIATKFSLEIVSISHEKLSQLHVRLYSRELVRRIFTAKSRVVDRSLSCRVISKFSGAMGRILASGLRDQRLTPFGHSVTAIYKKRA